MNRLVQTLSLKHRSDRNNDMNRNVSFLLGLCVATLSTTALAAGLPGLSQVQSAEALQSLSAPAQVAAVTDANFDEVSTALVLEAIQQHGDDLAHLSDLAGLNPENYLRFRRPDPVVSGDLTKMKLHPGALLFAHRFPGHFLKARTAADYPAHARANAPAWMQKEAEAFRVGVLVALAKSQHPVVGHVLAADIRSAGTVTERALAAKLLGESGAPFAVSVLDATLADKTAPVMVHHGALVGLGKVRTDASLAVLARTVKSGDAARRETAIRALGNLGSKWAHQSTGGGDELRKKAALLLVEVLPQVAGTSAAKSAAQSLATIGHPASLAGVEQLAHSSNARVASDATYAQRLLKRSLAR